MAGGNIKVVVRCRPLNNREIKRGAKSLVRMEGSQTILEPPDTVGNKDAEPGSRSGRAIEKKPQVFSFDKSYWSAGPRDEPQYASQQTLYDDLGVELLDHSFEGFNTCIIAYGQTGSGKSYSMMGYGADKGIIPLTTSELFQRVAQKQAHDTKLSYTVEVSYIEIYNEKVRDLLNPKNKGNLRVREHPSLGPYVEDLSRLVVENFEGMMTLMDEGNKARTVASTNMNETSSRSHAVFTLVLTQRRRDEMTGMDGEKVSKISLVDLAGSERANSTGATGARLKEGANINKSLITLGKVIAALAQASSEPVKGRKRKDDFVPYRDSVLTWLLKESLGGNSMTAVIAAISPADYEETLSTLRYADAAKQIKTHAVVNEDPNAKLIRELKEELEVLRARAAGATGEEGAFDPSIPPEKQIVTYYTKEGELRKVNKLELQDQLQASEKLMESLNLTWEEKLVKTQAIHVERERALEELGISVDKNLVGLHAPQKHPSLVNLNEDPLMSECLVYQIKPGRTVAGSLDAGAHIKLSGSHILAEHCIFDNVNGRVTLEAIQDSLTMVNGKRIPAKNPVTLHSGFRVILGDYHVFRYNDPAAVRKQRELQQAHPFIDGEADGAASGRDSPSGAQDLMDWTAARREAADFDKLGDQDLDKLFDDIVKVRTLRRRPESRVGPPETWSEPDNGSKLTSTAYTEESMDASTNPWGAPGTSVTSPSISTPNIADLLKDDIRVEEAGGGTSGPDTPSKVTRQSEDAAIEHQHMQKQLRHIAEEMKRLRSQAVARALEQTNPYEPEVYSARQLGLLGTVVKQWRQLKSFATAEDILTSAVDLREANVLANELSKSVRYNFIMLPQTTALPTSHQDGHAESAELKDDGEGQQSATSSKSAAVVVLDSEVSAVYIWSLEKFRSQLTKMRSLKGIIDRPSYSQHFKVDAPFFDRPAPSYSFIGSAMVSLGCLSKMITSGMQIPINCPYTMEALGSCRVTLKVSDQNDLVNTSGRGTPDSRRPFSPSPPADLVVGSKLSFILTVDCVKGLSSEDFICVHAQTKLSSITGPDIAADDVFTSHPVDLRTSSVSHLSLRRPVTVNVTPSILKHLRHEYATLDFFAQVRPAYLARLERWFEKREAGTGSSSGTPSPSSGALSPAGRPQKPSMRRCETDFVTEEHHDVVAWLEIRELGSSGLYVPAEAHTTRSAPGEVFQLHQGLQRRVHLGLTHSSGKALPIGRISHLKLGLLRFIDAKGKVSQPVSTTEVDIRLASEQDAEYMADGTARIDVSGVWDSSAHDSILLNRKTSSDQSILVKMTWLVDFDSTDEPAVFAMDVGVRILDREARPASRLLGIFSSTRVLRKTSTLFTVTLTPPLTRSARDLWRLDTARKHVRGEEGLGDWKPRGISLLEDFTRVRRSARNQADVQAVKAVLEHSGAIALSPSGMIGSEDARQQLLRKCVELWQRQMAQSSERKFARDSPEEAAVARRIRKLLPDLAPKLVPVVKQQIKMDTVAKTGFLHILKDSPNNVWARQWMVLRRPYLHLYDSNNERDETGVVSLTGCSVILSPDVEILLERRFAFTIFTRSNSYILHAANAKEMSDWVQVISVTGGNVGPVR